MRVPQRDLSLIHNVERRLATEGAENGHKVRSWLTSYNTLEELAQKRRREIPKVPTVAQLDAFDEIVTKFNSVQRRLVIYAYSKTSTKDIEKACTDFDSGSAGSGRQHEGVG